MTLVEILVFSLDLFFSVTFLGISLVLFNIFRKWRETSIGLWASGSLLVSISNIFNLFSYRSFGLNSPFLYLYAYRFMIISFTIFGISHLIARRKLLDIILALLLVFLCGLIFSYTLNGNLPLLETSGLIYINWQSINSSFNLFIVTYFYLLYIILVRDSIIMYSASLKMQYNKYRKSVAITHIIAWQFWGISNIIFQIIARSSHIYFYLGFYFIFLLVPIITLGSRPFDWVREGYEPILLLFLDEYGNTIYSWSITTENPLLLEGSLLATANSILEKLSDQKIDTMTINYENFSLFMKKSLKFKSILLTTGYHRSFSKIIEKIHDLLIHQHSFTVEFGSKGNELPKELKWLLNQLLSTNVFEDKIKNT